MSKTEQTSFRSGVTFTPSLKYGIGKDGSMSSQKFPHRKNTDGTYDSICLKCFLTIATVGREAELQLLETSHVCEPLNLYRVNHANTTGATISS